VPLKFPTVNAIEYCGDILTKTVGACQKERVLGSTERKGEAIPKYGKHEERAKVPRKKR